ncbi:MAG: SIS domain-containing protein [Rhodospirillales bacterium]
MSDFTDQFLDETAEIIAALDRAKIEELVVRLAGVRDGAGRLFIIGVGGSAGHAGHAVNDFRKICGFEAYAPTDNVSELTARVNDEGWESVFEEWLKGSKIDKNDGVLVFSVGGGNKEKNISVNIIKALELAKSQGCVTLGIVGSDDGFTAKNADTCVVIPPLHPDRRTPHTEGLAAVIWHLVVSHPLLKIAETKWESVR